MMTVSAGNARVLALLEQERRPVSVFQRAKRVSSLKYLTATVLITKGVFSCLHVKILQRNLTNLKY